MAQRWMVGVAAAVVLAAGCGAGDTSGTDVGQPSVTASSPSPEGGCTVPGDGGLESILALVPDDAGNREYTVVADLRAFLDSQGKELPGDFNEIEWVGDVARFSPTELLQNAISQADTDEDPLADEYGIGLGDIDQAVVAGLAPEATELLVGEFDPAAVEQVVGADPFWSDQLQTVESDGQTFYSWGDDGEVQIEGRSAIRKLGIGGRLWVDERVAALTRATATMEAFLAGCTGGAPTLADDEDYAGIAQRLDEYEGAFNATFTDQVRDESDLEGGTGSRGSAVADGTEPLQGVTAYGFASGPSDDPSEARIRLVVASGTNAEATANEARLVEQIESGTAASSGLPWSDLLRVADTDVDGRFVIVELRADSSWVLEQALLRRDALVVSEG